MSTDIVLLSLSNWTESHISAIYKATTQSDTSNALDNFLEKNADITVNGKKISRDDFGKELQSEKFLEVGAIVTFNNIVEVPADKSAPVLVIYLYFHFKFRINWSFLWLSFRQGRLELSSPLPLQKLSGSEMRLWPIKSSRLSMLCMFLTWTVVQPFCWRIFSSIEQDPSIPVPPPSPIHGFSDRRRVKELNLVITDTPVPFGPI